MNFLLFCQEKQNFILFFWNFIADTRLAEKKIINLIQDYLMLIQDYLLLIQDYLLLIQDYLSRKENVLTRSSPFSN